MIQVEKETNWKIWAAVGFFGFVLVYLATFSAGQLVQKAVGAEPGNYSYEMPRVEGAEAPFDLSGRAVDRKVIGSVIEEVETAAVFTAGTTGKAVKGALVNGKNVKKLTPAQEKIAKAVKAKQLADKAKADKKAKLIAQDKARHKRFEIYIQEQQRQKQLMSEQFAKDAAKTETIANAAYTPQAVTEETPKDDSKKEEDDDEALKLSAAQWRTLLQVSPTAANAAKFALALDKKKIDGPSFYQITKELLMDSAPDRRKAGLLLLSMVPTIATYEFMVINMKELGGEAQAEVKKEIAKYSQPSHLGVTSRVISNSKESSVISSALNNLTVAVENFKKQPAPGTISSQSGAKALAITAASLNQFLTGLGTLGTSEDPALAAQANTLKQSIQQIKK